MKYFVKSFLALVLVGFAFIDVAHAEPASAIEAKRAELNQKASDLSASSEQHKGNIDAKINELKAKKESMADNPQAAEKIDAKIKKLEKKKSSLEGRTSKAERNLNKKMGDLKKKEKTLK